MSDSHWIQKAIKRPGALKAKAKRAGMSISEYCSKPNLSTRTKRQCALAKTLSKLRPKADLGEIIGNIFDKFDLSKLTDEQFEELAKGIENTFGGETASLFSGGLSDIMLANTVTRQLDKNQLETYINNFYRHYGLGGIVNKEEDTQQIEAEGGEIVNTAGQDIELKGPRHEQGGIDLNLKPGDIVYSDRIKIGNKTIAEREKKRKKYEDKLLKLISETNDTLSKKTLERVKEINNKEREQDIMYQEKVKEFINNLLNLNNQANTGQNKAAYGYIAKIPETANIDIYGDNEFDNEDTENIELTNEFKSGYSLPTENNWMKLTLNQINNKSISDILNNTLNNTVKTAAETTAETTSDYYNPEDLLNFHKYGYDKAYGLGLTGTGISAFGPLAVTLASYKNTRDFENIYKNFGSKTLQALYNQYNQIAENYSDLYNKIGQNLATSNLAIENTTKSGGAVQNAKLAALNSANRAITEANKQKQSALDRLLNTITSTEDKIEQTRMQGAYQADMLNRRQQDNLYTQLAQNVTNLGLGLQSGARQMSQMAQNEYQTSLLKSMTTMPGKEVVYENGKVIVRDIQKPNIKLDEIFNFDDNGIKAFLASPIAQKLTAEQLQQLKSITDPQEFFKLAQQFLNANLNS